MKFEVGKFYNNGSGRVLHILAEVSNCTGYFNPCFVAEEPGNTGFLPVGTDDVSAEGWSEIPSHEYYQVWLVGNEESEELQKLATPPEDAEPTGSDRRSASQADGGAK